MHFFGPRGCKNLVFYDTFAKSAFEDYGKMQCFALSAVRFASKITVFVKFSSRAKSGSSLVVFLRV